MTTDFLFETSWEVCNKVGGIHTVLSTKANTLIKDLNEVLNEAEFARYAPGNASQAMDKVYSMAMDVIDKMENSIKK